MYGDKFITALKIERLQEASFKSLYTDINRMLLSTALNIDIILDHIDILFPRFRSVAC